MNHNTVPAWDDRDELLRALSGDWQSFTQPLSQREALQLGEYVCGGLLEYRFEVKVTVIDAPQRVLRIWVVVSGEYNDHLQPLIERTINERLPPGTLFKIRRRLCELRRTARGAWFVENGFPMAEFTLQPQALRVCDERWEEREEQASVESDGDTCKESQGDPDVIAYRGLKLNRQTRRLTMASAETWAELTLVQVAIVNQFFKSRESWLSRDTIEQAINDAKTKPGQQPYRSDDLNVVSRHLSTLRGALRQFGADVVSDYHGSYRIDVGCNHAKGGDEVGT